MVPAVWPALDAKSGWIGAASFVKFAAGQRPGRDGTLGALDSDREGRLACLFLAKAERFIIQDALASSVHVLQKKGERGGW